MLGRLTTVIGRVGITNVHIGDCRYKSGYRRATQCQVAKYQFRSKSTTTVALETLLITMYSPTKSSLTYLFATCFNRATADMSLFQHFFFPQVLRNLKQSLLIQHLLEPAVEHFS